MTNVYSITACVVGGSTMNHTKTVYVSQINGSYFMAVTGNNGVSNDNLPFRAIILGV